ncbi:MAG: hypothetical protein IJZ23_02840 [Roseburia sp.]|nr:hypothetical protein [Roseburia sp.]
MLALLAGCGEDRKGTVSGTNYYYPTTETEQQTEEEAAPVKAELSAEHYMIMSNDMTMEHMILQHMESGKQYLYYYSLTTNFLDKYGNHTSVSYFEPGRIITIGGKDSEGKLKSAQISDDVWEYENIVRYEIDEERGVFEIADTKYSFDEDVYVVSAGDKIRLSAIKEEDELRVVGMNKEILSVAVTTGQGTIVLKNTELFEDSFVQIGNKIFAEITGEIELEVPEGTYMVTVAHKGYGGSGEYTVERDKTTVIDLEELKGEGPKKGIITFVIGTTDENADADVLFKIDGAEVNFDEPIELAYGVHSIEAESFGYETYAKKLFVNSEKATIFIGLDEESSVSIAENDKDATDSETNTDLAGSLAGSTSNSDSGSASSTDELIEALTNALSDDSSSDYISTLTELLSNIVY